MKLYLSIIVFSMVLATPCFATNPSFDCAKSDSSVEQLVCKDSELASLDLELARIFKLAKNGPDLQKSDKKILVAMQRGWIKGRNDCWKATDLRKCVLDSYVMRIHELRQNHAEARSHDDQGISHGPMTVSCEGMEASISLSFVGDDPKHVYLGWSDQSIVTNLSPSASGSKYIASYYGGDYSFWLKGDEAIFERPNEKALSCKIIDIE